MIVKFTVGRFNTTVNAKVNVRANVNVARASFNLRIPMTKGGPQVAMDGANACGPSLVAAVEGFKRVAARGQGIVLRIARVMLSAIDVGTRGVANGAVARPVAYLELRRPVFPHAAVQASPPVVIT